MKTLSPNKRSNLILEKNEKKTGFDNLNFQDLYNFIEKYKGLNQDVFISIILPMYNEENTIKNVLENLPNHKLIEIIIIDDHSTDNSKKEIEKVRLYRDIKIISHETNKGYGAAIMTGIRNAKGQILVTMDSDGQHSPDDILTMVKPILKGEADYTIGSRYLGTYFYQLPVSTRLGELFVEKLIQIFFSKKIVNNQNGFRAFSRKVLSIFDDVKFDGYAFCTEQILRASLDGYKIKECPIKVYSRQYGTSHIVLSKLAVNIFSLFFHYFVKKIKITVIKKDRFGALKIYEKPLKKSKELKYLKFNKEQIYFNSVVFIEHRPIVAL